MKSQNTIFIKIFVAAVFSCACVFGFVYVYSNITTKSDIANTLKEQIQNELDRRDRITALNSEIKAITPDKVALESHFADSNDVVPFLDNLQALAKQAGAPADVSSLDVSKEGDKLLVQMKASGNFNAVHKLVALLENSQYEIDFESVQLQTKPLIDGAGKVSTGTQVWDLYVSLILLSFNAQ